MADEEQVFLGKFIVGLFYIGDYWSDDVKDGGASQIHFLVL